MSVELYAWQKPSRDKLVEVFQSGSLIALDGSDTGTGKTFVALDTVKTLKRPALVICPKAVINSWRRAADMLGCPDILLDVINSEKLQTGKTRWFNKGNLPKMKEAKWTMPDGAMICYDEVQKGCAGPDTQTTKIVALSKAYKIPVLAMSATMADSPLKMRALGYLLGLHQFNKSSFYDFCARNGCKRNPWNGYDFPKGPKGAKLMAGIHALMADRMTRIRIDDVPEFPQCDTQAQLFNLGSQETAEINSLYEDLEVKLMKIHTNPMVAILYARQHVEFLKVRLLHELASDCLEEEHSPVIFVNFRDTMQALTDLFAAQGIEVSVIHGSQNDTERNSAIDRFQNNDTHVMIAMTQAGGTGVSLHDLKGRPRRSFITPSYNAVEFKQLLGRIWRAGSLSKAIQTIVLAEGTVEERVYKAIVGKLNNMAALNDGDLSITKG